MSTYKTRNFTFTNWNLNSEEVFKNNDSVIRFMAFGLEKCPSTGREHHQGYLVFHNQRSCATNSCNRIGQLFELTEDCVHAHIEPMRGSLKSNEKYCSKESSLIKLGEEPSQGARVDLKNLKDRIMRGEAVDDIAAEDPIHYHQYGRTLEKLEAIALRKKYRNWMTSGEWFYGPSGTGKSHRAFESFSEETHFVKDLECKWWDGYKGQPIVILEDFRGQISLSQLLRLVDKYPLSVPMRGKESIPFLAKRVIITSSKHPALVYYNCGESLDQIERRFTVIEMAQKCSEGNNKTSEPEI